MCAVVFCFCKNSSKIHPYFLLIVIGVRVRVKIGGKEQWPIRSKKKWDLWLNSKKQEKKWGSVRLLSWCSQAHNHHFHLFLLNLFLFDCVIVYCLVFSWQKHFNLLSFPEASQHLLLFPWIFCFPELLFCAFTFTLSALFFPFFCLVCWLLICISWILLCSRISSAFICLDSATRQRLTPPDVFLFLALRLSPVFLAASFTVCCRLSTNLSKETKPDLSFRSSLFHWRLHPELSGCKLHVKGKNKIK